MRPSTRLRLDLTRHRSSGPLLLARYKADTLGLANNANVTSWPDSTSTQGAITASGTALVYKTATQNGLNTVSVSNTNGTSSWTWNSAVADPFTILLAIKLNLASQTGTIITVGGGANDIQIFLTGSGLDMNNGTDMVRWTPDTTFHIITLFFNGSSSLLRVDGVQQGAVGNPGSNGLGTGTGGNLAGQSNGYTLGELVVYGGASIPTAEESSLRTKWGTA